MKTQLDDKFANLSKARIEVEPDEEQPKTRGSDKSKPEAELSDERSFLERLPNELFLQVAENVDIAGLGALTQVCHSFQSKCEDEAFWRLRTLLDLPAPLPVAENPTFSEKEIYRANAFFECPSFARELTEFLGVLSWLDMLYGETRKVTEKSSFKLQFATDLTRLFKQINKSIISHRIDPVEGLNSVLEYLTIKSWQMNLMPQEPAMQTLILNGFARAMFSTQEKITVGDLEKFKIIYDQLHEAGWNEEVDPIAFLRRCFFSEWPDRGCISIAELIEDLALQNALDSYHEAFEDLATNLHSSSTAVSFEKNFQNTIQLLWKIENDCKERIGLDAYSKSQDYYRNVILFYLERSYYIESPSHETSTPETNGPVLVRTFFGALRNPSNLDRRLKALDEEARQPASAATASS